MSKLPVPDHVFRPLTGWVHGTKFYVKSFLHYENETILPERIFIALDTCYEVHEAPKVPLKTLEQSWLDTKAYVAHACKLLRRQRAGYSLTPEERTLVLTNVGPPPDPAWPLYFFTVGDYPDEEIVYIGKTNSVTHRFVSGHSAITALHHPEYQDRTKRLYLATVTIYSDEGNYAPLEWIHPKALRDFIWSDIEAQLIYHFQPTLNKDLKSSDYSKCPNEIILHNYCGTKSFDASVILPSRLVEASEWHSLL